MSLLEIIARVGDSFVVMVVSKETGYKKRDPGEGKGDRIGRSNSSGLSYVVFVWVLVGALLFRHCHKGEGERAKSCCVCLCVGGSIVVSSLSQGGRREGQPRLIAVNRQCRARERGRREGQPRLVTVNRRCGELAFFGEGQGEREDNQNGWWC